MILIYKNGIHEKNFGDKILSDNKLILISIQITRDVKHDLKIENCLKRL